MDTKSILYINKDYWDNNSDEWFGGTALPIYRKISTYINTLAKAGFVVEQMVEETTRVKLGLNKECIMMCGGNISNLGEFTLDDATKWYEKSIQHPCKWVIEYNGNCIGVVGLTPYKEDNKARLSIEIYDINLYACGIGTNVIKVVLNYAFEVLEYHKVYLRVLDYNTRAIKCFEKCGFIKEGLDREGALINDTYCSDIYMGIIKPEYSKLNIKMGLYDNRRY